MNVCFIACFNKTIYFKKITDQLSNAGFNIYWISVSPKWTKYLLETGINRSHILSLLNSKALKFQTNKSTLEKIYTIEKTNIHNLKQVYYMDRVLSKKPWSYVEQLFSYLVEEISLFINTKNISIVFGEATAAHEVIAAMICNTYGQKYLVPHTIRLPNNRFAFFEGYLQTKIFKLHSSDWNEKETSTFIENYIKNKPKPNYFNQNNKTLSYKDVKYYINLYKKLKDIFYEKNENFSEKSIFHHFFYEKKYLKPFYAYFIFKNIKFVRINKPSKYVLYTMHVQPEASIDVLGIENNNQYETIKKIAINLPFDYTLLVKEHLNGLGTRSVSDLQKIASIPGVILVDPNQNTTDLLKYVELVCTVSGTIALEAALLKKKSVTFSPMFFNTLPLCFFQKDPSKVTLYLNKTFNFNKGELVQKLSDYLPFTHKGIISDPVSDPNCISNKNIEMVSHAFKHLIFLLTKKK
jgi:hypothetical protein